MVHCLSPIILFTVQLKRTVMDELKCHLFFENFMLQYTCIAQSLEHT